MLDVPKTKNNSVAYKERADDVLLSRGKSTDGKKFTPGTSSAEIFSILKGLQAN